jgi:hypothetical protein
MRTHLNPEASAIADCNLHKDDLDTIAATHGLAVSSVIQIVKVRLKCEPEVIDTIIKFTKIRLECNKARL